jgi:hypothetical protein
MTHQSDEPAASRRAPQRPPTQPTIQARAGAPPPAALAKPPLAKPQFLRRPENPPAAQARRPRSVTWLVRLSCIIAAVSFVGTGSTLFRRGVFLASHGSNAIPAVGYILVAIGVVLVVVLPAGLLVLAFRRRP